MTDKTQWAVKSKKKLRSMLLLAIGLGLVLMASVGAWFSISKTPRVSDMGLYVNAPTGLELSASYNAGDGGWVQNLNFSELIRGGNSLRPVTWSDAQQSFLTVRHDTDGRLLSSYKTLPDEVGSNGYFIHAVFYARSDRPCKVSLAEAVEVNDGKNGAGTYLVGVPEWNGAGHTDLGGGAQYAARVGFRVAKIDPQTGASTGDSDFFIYEPNADKHLDGTTQLLPTKSVDGTQTLVAEDHILTQTTSTWAEASPARAGVTIKTLGEFLQNAPLFSLEAEDMVRIDLYLWLEGQDHDCYGMAAESTLLASIQFKADFSAQSGMTDIQ